MVFVLSESKLNKDKYITEDLYIDLGNYPLIPWRNEEKDPNVRLYVYS